MMKRTVSFSSNTKQNGMYDEILKKQLLHNKILRAISFTLATLASTLIQDVTGCCRTAKSQMGCGVNREVKEWRSVILNHLFFSDKFHMWGFSPHAVLVGHTHPRGEVGFWFKVLPKVLVTFEVAEVSLQGEGCQEEVGLLPLDTLREQHLFPQVPVVIVPGCPVTAGHMESNINQIKG